MKKLVAMFATGAICALTLTAVSTAGNRSSGWTAKLTAAQEVPAQVVKDRAAHGQFTAKLDGNKLSWTLTFSNLTGHATAAHIHLGAKGKAGNVLVPLCGPCKSGDKGTTKIGTAVTAAFAKGKLYVNVHTAKNPNGEIRGQITAG